MRVFAKTRNDLEWSRLLAHLAARATGEAAARACLELPFMPPREARARLAEIGELLACLRADDPPPSLPSVDVLEALALVRGRGAVPGQALLDIATNLELFASIAAYLDNRKDACPLCHNALDGHTAPSRLGLARLAAEIRSCFDPDGALSDTASRELSRLRQRAIALRKQLLSRLSTIAEEHSDLLRDLAITIRNDRHVLPVRSDAHRRLHGIVHGSSQTGGTIYVEPEQVVETGNELTLAREDVLREEARILAALRDAVADQLDEVTRACAAIVEIEARIAAARLARDLDAHVPIEGAPGEVSLVAARHPLLVLDGVQVVPGTIEVGAGRTVLISGPNAGGKTVVLKTIGLFGLMLRAGLPVPAAPESRFSVPTAILTDIGDDQSLEDNLSTFSAHMRNIATILEQAREGSLVLLDELAAGTDPTEGTALAEAILTALDRMGATTLATTHYDVLKSRAREAGFVNAAMGFDADAGRPTFRLSIGVPGSSSALAVAERFGIPDGVLKAARALLPEGVRRLATAMEEMERERTRAQLERIALAEQRRALEEATRRQEAELARLRAHRDAVVDKESRALLEAIRAAREKVRDAESSVKRRRVEAADVRTARSLINEVAARTEPGGDLSAKTRDDSPGRPARVEDLAAGTRVHVVSMGKTAIVDSPVKGNTLFVAAGTIRLRVTVDDLNILDDTTKPKRAARRAQTVSAVAADQGADPVRTSDNTLDLRGRRADEAIGATDAFLDGALGAGIDVVFILHGHGTGALRDAIREHLDGSRYVARHRPGERAEGGDGVTAVWLR